MSNVIKRRGKGFTAIPNEVIRNEALSIEARGLLAILLSCADNWSFKASHMMKVCGVGRDKFHRMMGELKTAGHVLVTPRHSEDGTFIGSDWEISAEAGPLNNRTPENPNSGKPVPLRRTISKNTKREENPKPLEGDFFTAMEEPIQEDQTDAQFDRFWKEYPKKAGKPSARRAFDKAIKKVPPEELISAAQRYAAWLTNKKPFEFRPPAKHPQGWLNDERWNDPEIGEAKPAQSKAAQLAERYSRDEI